MNYELYIHSVFANFEKELHTYVVCGQTETWKVFLQQNYVSQQLPFFSILFPSQRLCICFKRFSSKKLHNLSSLLVSRCSICSIKFFTRQNRASLAQVYRCYSTCGFFKVSQEDFKIWSKKFYFRMFHKQVAPVELKP